MKCGFLLPIFGRNTNINRPKGAIYMDNKQKAILKEIGIIILVAVLTIGIFAAAKTGAMPIYK